MKTLIAISLALAITTIQAEEMKESGTLIIFSLSIESSYSENFERPASKKFDTVQWWIGEHGAWRIKTFAIDSDVHPYRIETQQPKKDLIELAYSNTKKTYGDVIKKIDSIEVDKGLSPDDLNSLFRSNDLEPRCKWVDAGYLLWLPDSTKYKTKSGPNKR